MRQREGGASARGGEADGRDSVMPESVVRCGARASVRPRYIGRVDGRTDKCRRSGVGVAGLKRKVPGRGPGDCWRKRVASGGAGNGRAGFCQAGKRDAGPARSWPRRDRRSFRADVERPKKGNDAGSTRLGRGTKLARLKQGENPFRGTGGICKRARPRHPKASPSCTAYSYGHSYSGQKAS